MKLAVHGIGAASPFDDCPEKMGAVYRTGGDIDDRIQPAGDDLFRAQTSDLTRLVPKSRLRRVDHYSRMALLAAGRALEDSKASLVSRENTGLIVATGYGALGSTFSFLDSYIEKGDRLAAPTHFSNSVHNAAAAHISICYGITGPCLTVSQFDMSFISALVTAGTWLETGQAEAVLVGTSDEWCQVMEYCIQRFSKDYDKSPCSFGEGAAFFMVTREDFRPKYGFFEEISMGRNLDSPGCSDIFFSPSSAPSREVGGKGKPMGWKNRVLKRKKAFSPTDTAMDALAAFSGGQGGERVCCLKQGADGTIGRVTVTRWNKYGQK